MKKIDLITDYLNGQLEGDNLVDFENKLKKNAELREEVNDYRYLMDGFRTLKAEAFEKELKSISKQNDHDNSTNKQKISSNKYITLKRVILSSAAVIILGLIISQFWNPFFSDPISNFSNNEMDIVQSNMAEVKNNIRGQKRGQQQTDTNASEKDIQTFNSAINNFEKRDFQSSIYDLNQISSSKSLDQASQYLLAHNYFYSERFPEASRTFKSLFELKNLTSDFGKNEVGWFYVLSELKIYEQNKSEENKSALKSHVQYYLENANPNFIVNIEKAKALEKLLDK